MKIKDNIEAIKGVQRLKDVAKRNDEKLFLPSIAL